MVVERSEMIGCEAIFLLFFYFILFIFFPSPWLARSAIITKDWTSWVWSLDIKLKTSITVRGPMTSHCAPYSGGDSHDQMRTSIIALGKGIRCQCSGLTVPVYSMCWECGQRTSTFSINFLVWFLICSSTVGSRSSWPTPVHIIFSKHIDFAGFERSGCWWHRLCPKKDTHTT